MLTSPCASAAHAPAASNRRDTATGASLRAARRANGVTFMIGLPSSGFGAPVRLALRRRSYAALQPAALLGISTTNVKKLATLSHGSSLDLNCSNSTRARRWRAGERRRGGAAPDLSS